MEVINLEKWSEFNGALEDVYKKHGVLRVDDGKALRDNMILYRGHGSSEWELTTTLERVSKNEWKVLDYIRQITACYPQIESFNGVEFNGVEFAIENWPEFEIKYKEKVREFDPEISFYEYWTYLRQHGYPSPLLDWTSSPYIAAFFAFFERIEAEQVSIFVYIERPRGGKGGFIGNPKINVHGKYVRTHKRHFLQKANYTTCTKYLKKEKEHLIDSHEKVFKHPVGYQDVLIKINLPAKERISALKDLDKFNINYFSLFQTEDALIKSLAFSELELGET